MVRLRTRLLCLALPAALLLAGTGPAAAATFTWSNAAGGSFQTTTNWSPNTGFPGAADTAIFGSPTGAYTVTSTGSVSTTGLQVSQGTPTLSLTTGQTYTVSGADGFSVGTTSGLTANLKISGGGTLSLSSFNFTTAGIGAIAGATGNVTVDGAGTTLTTTGASVDIADNGTGTLTVQNGASASIGNTTAIGAFATGNGTITVTGAGSSLTLGTNCGIAETGTANLAINNGASASFGAGTVICGNTGNGTVTVGQIGTGTLTLNGAAVGVSGFNTNGILNVNAGSTVTSNGAFTINTGTVTLNGTWNQNVGLITVAGGTLNLNGGTLTATASGTGITVTSGSINVNSGTLTVSGSSTLNLNGGTLTATAAGTGVAVSGGGVLNVSGASANVLNLTRSGAGQINMTNGVLTATGTFNNGASSQFIDGNTTTATPQLTLDQFATTTGLTDLDVGLNHHGAVVVTGASTLNANDFILGLNAGSNGSLIVIGSLAGIPAKAVLANGNTSYVGLLGTGSLVVDTTLNTSGGSVYAAGNAGSSGSIEVNGGTFTLGTGTLNIGNSGVGSLLLHGGGTITQTGQAYIGDLAGSSGTATVTGASWTTGSLYVGLSGTGSLTVLAGGAVTTTQLAAVSYSGGTGTVNLTGGSWTASNTFTIGDNFGAGGTGVLNVNQGGSLTTTGSTAVGMYPGGTLNIAGGTVTAAGISALGGRVTWSSGALNITGGSGLTLDTATFGTGVSLGIPQTLTVAGALTVPAGQSFTLAGGTVSAGSLAGSGPINLQTGSLTVSSSNFIIGSLGRLGSTVTVGPGLSLVAGAVNSFAVNADGLLLFTGGSVFATGGITNAGEIQFASPASTLSGTGTLTNTGRLDGTGRISANLTNNANGVITEDAGQRLVFSGATNTNNLNGTISLTGGTVEFTGALTNASGGFISGRGTFRGSSANTSGVGLIDSGVVAFSGGTSDIFGKVQLPFVMGTTPGTGQIITAGGGTLTFHDDVVHNGTEIRTVSGSRTVFLGAESGAGPFTGTGVVEMDGDLRPGNSPASVSFAGDLVLTTSTNLHAEIGGTTLGTQYDNVTVAGQVSFAGNLDAQLINGFTPVLGQRFDIVTFGTRQGSFGSYTGLSLGGGLVLTPSYDASHFSVAVTPPAATGLTTWTGTTSGSWNDPSNWAPTTVPLSSSNTQLVFGVTPNAATSVDIPGTLTLNQLTFYPVAPVFSVGGNGLNFVTNAGAVLPQIVLNSTNGVTISAPLTLTNNLTVSGVGSLMLSGPIGGAGSLTYTGSATLTLGNSSNSYTGGTIVNSGTVQTTASGALPAGQVVSVLSGTLDLGATSQSIGALNLSSSSPNPSPQRPIVQGGSLAGLTLGGNVTYTPSPGGGVSPSALISVMLNLGGATRTFNVTAAGSDPYDVVFTNHITGTGGLTKAGPGSVVVTNTSSYSGATTINGGALYLAATNALPATSSVVLANGGFVNASPSVGTAEVIPGNFSQSIGSIAGPAGTTFTLLAGTLTLGNDNTNATFSGTLNIPGTTLVKGGTGTQTLSGTNSQINTTVNGGMLAVTTDMALGQAGSPVTVNAFGTLTYASTTTTAGRAFTLNSGTMAVATNQTATLSNDTIAGGFLAGPGAFAFTGGTASSGVTTANSAVIHLTGSASLVNFSNGGALTTAAGLATPAGLTRFTNQGSGSITIGAGSMVNAADFQTYGMLTLTPNTSNVPTVMTNTGTTPLYFNGGSQTFIGTSATADPTGQNILDYVDLHGQNAVVAGGLFVNNGGIYDTVGAGTGTIIAEYGALVKGAGFYQNTVKTQNGGKFQTGNSPGSATFGNFVFGPGGVSNYIFAIDDATGTAGPSPGSSGLVSGWGLIKAVQAMLGAGATSGDFTWTATPSNPLTVAIDTLVNPTMVGTDVAGPMADFDPTQSYSWTAARWSGIYSGPTDAATLTADTSFDTSGFVNPIAGTFGWSLDSADQTLSLVYTPSSVPEPSTLALTALAGLSWASRRWRRNSRAVS